MKTLQPFNAAAICPKCRSDDIHACWIEANQYRWHDDGPKEESISRVCKCCQYQWYEKPLDKVKP